MSMSKEEALRKNNEELNEHNHIIRESNLQYGKFDPEIDHKFYMWKYEQPYSGSAQVKYAMAYASRYLANNETPSLKQSCFLWELGKTDLWDTKILWTALMVFGETYKFDHNSIKTHFEEDISRERGFFSRYSTSSLYETEFKQHLEPYMLTISKDAELYDGISGLLSI